MTSDLEVCHVGWTMNTAKDPFLEGGPGACEAFAGTLIKLRRSGVAPVEASSCNLTRTDSGLDLALEDKGTLHAAGFFYPGEGQGLQHVFQEIPRFLLCVGM